MTAEEIIDNCHRNEEYPSYIHELDVVEAMKKYASIKCAQQRQLCLDNASVSWENEDDGYLLDSETILKASEPLYD